MSTACFLNLSSEGMSGAVVPAGRAGSSRMGSTQTPKRASGTKRKPSAGNITKGFQVHLLKSYSSVQYWLCVAACKTPKEGISELAGEERCGRRMQITPSPS